MFTAQLGSRPTSTATRSCWTESRAQFNWSYHETNTRHCDIGFIEWYINNKQYDYIYIHMTLWNLKSFQSCQGEQIHGPRFGLSVFEMLTVSRVKLSWQALGHDNKCGRRPGADGTMKRRQCQVRLSLVIPCDTWPDSVNLEPKSLIKAPGYSR